MPFKLTEFRVRPPGPPGLEYIAHQQAFMDVNDVSAHLQEHHGLSSGVTTLNQLHIYASLTGVPETSILFGDGTRVRIEIVTTLSLAGPWLSSYRASLPEIIGGWNRFDDHPGSGVRNEDTLQAVVENVAWLTDPNLQEFVDRAKEAWNEWKHSLRLTDAMKRDDARRELRLILRSRGEEALDSFPWEV